MDTLTRFHTPQLELLHRGKVRDSYRLDRARRLIVVTDRLSAFDRVLETPIPRKGAVLNSLSRFWFEATRGIVENHLLATPDHQVSVVREAQPIRIEMVVRGYLTGSMWRGYEKGKRRFSGVQVPDGLEKNERLPGPILTPTTKEESDREITPAEIVEQGWADARLYAQMEQVALELYRFGSELLARRGLVLVDTKYEFGLVDGRLVLIDEIHTPDSSRFWAADDYERDPLHAAEHDKEYVRRWLMEHRTPAPVASDGAGARAGIPRPSEPSLEYPTSLPPEVVEEASRRYLALFERVTGKPLEVEAAPVVERVRDNLVRAGLLRDGFIAIVMGSPRDRPHAEKLREVVERYGVVADLRVVSAHRNGEELVHIAAEYDDAAEPGAVLAVAGLSNGLGGALASNLTLPVINCPPFKDAVDLALNINSSLMMPSRIPAATVVGVENAALAALRSLNLRRLREQFAREIAESKAQLKEEDEKLRRARRHEAAAEEAAGPGGSEP